MAASAPGYTSNGTLGRVCTIDNPRGENKDAEKLKQAEQRWADHISGRNPLPPEQSLALRGEINQLSQSVNPGQPNAWGPYSASEQQYLANQRTNANNMGIMFMGPIAGGPAAGARLLGAPEAAVESAGEMG